MKSSIVVVAAPGIPARRQCRRCAGLGRRPSPRCRCRTPKFESTHAGADVEPARRASTRKSAAEDERFLRAWCAGDVKAGNDLIRKYYQPICNLIYARVGCSAASMGDVAHQAFAVVAQKKAEIREFRPYLYRVARLKLIEHGRRRDADEVVEEALRSPLDLPSEALEEMQEKALMEDVVARALRSLDLDDQFVLALKNLREFTQRQVADVLGISQGQVAHRVAAARRRLDLAVKAIRKRGEAPKTGPRLRRFSSWLSSISARLIAKRPQAALRLAAGPSR